MALAIDAAQRNFHDRRHRQSDCGRGTGTLRIGQTEVCHLWNLVAEGTREGDVYRKLLEKLEQARQSLGGQVFDVLGKLQFEGRPLRELLIEAIRYGEQPDVRARLTRVVENAFDRAHLQDLLEERALAHDAMDASRVDRIREDM